MANKAITGAKETAAKAYDLIISDRPKWAKALGIAGIAISLGAGLLTPAIVPASIISIIAYKDLIEKVGIMLFTISQFTKKKTI